VPDQLKQHYAGYYQNISPVMQWSQGINRWLNARTLSVTSNGLSVSFHGFYKHRVLPVTERLYRDENASLSTIALLPDTDGHTLIQCRMDTYERIPALEYWAQMAGIALVCALVVSSLVMAPIWMVRRWLGKSHNPGPLSVRLLPLVSVVLLVAFAVLLGSGFRGFLSGRYIDDASVGTPNFQTVSLWLASLGFPLTAATSLYVVWRERHTPMKRAAYWYSFLVALTMTAAAVYHGWWGLIGLRLWT
jgi:hypothetical protein